MLTVPLSDALGRMRRGPALTLPPPRALRGPADAPVRFTEFTDVRCSHCAELHRLWEELERALPRGAVQRGVAVLPAGQRVQRGDPQPQDRSGAVPRSACADLPRRPARSARPGGSALCGAGLAHAGTGLRAGRFLRRLAAGARGVRGKPGDRRARGGTWRWPGSTTRKGRPSCWSTAGWAAPSRRSCTRSRWPAAHRSTPPSRPCRRRTRKPISTEPSRISCAAAPGYRL